LDWQLRSGEGRGDSSGKNLYENFAETGASAIFPISEKILNLADYTSNLENEAKEEEAKDKEIQAEIVRKSSLKKRMGMTPSTTSPASGEGAGTGTTNVPAKPGNKGKQLSGVVEAEEDDVVVDEAEGAREKGVEMDGRGRASELLTWWGRILADEIVSDLHLWTWFSWWMRGSKVFGVVLVLFHALSSLCQPVLVMHTMPWYIIYT
jgi:hypothetical protein